MQNIFQIGVLLLVSVVWTGHGGVVRQRRICTNFAISNSVDNSQESDSMDDENQDEDSGEYEDIPNSGLNYTIIENDTMRCEKDVNFCYALWSFDANGNVSFVRQGCWEISDQKSICERSECVAEYNPRLKERHLFCCCMENMCNSRVTSKEIIEEPTANDTLIAIPTFSPILLLTDPIVWSCLGLVFVILILIIVLLIYHSQTPSKPEMAPLAPSGPGYSSNLHSVDNLKLCSMLGQGKYGTVWKGIVNEQNVAVKIFPAHHKPYFLNEKDIYTLPMMENKSLLTYFGCDERRTIDDQIEYLLVLSLANLGCLQDWLSENTATFSTFCQMSTSIAHGLAFLHTEFRKGEFLKPCICHRDLNSRNILVRSDLTCCICDFGFAVKTFGPRYEYRGELALAETRSIIEVGTLRYMAPEVLEGAVNLRDCESALKQIDVYSLGLVLWELSTRCHDFYANGRESVPSYKSPYELEIGKHPSYEQMQILVSRQKARPQFPREWGCGTASKIIKETCEDCWDNDSEARLTALCVEERLLELNQYKNRYSNQENEIIKRHSPYLNGNNTTIFSPVCTNEPSIITPPNQRIPQSTDVSSSENSNNLCTSPPTKIFQGQSYTQTFVNPKLSIRASSKLNSAKITIGKIKRNKLDRKLQGVRAIIQKKLFKRMKLENEELSSNSVSEPEPKPIIEQEVLQNAPPKAVKRPDNLDIIPQRYFRNHSFDSSNSKPIPKSSRMEKKITNSRLSLHQPLPEYVPPRIVISKSANAMRLDEDEVDGQKENLLKRQRSLEVFREVFGTTQQSTERLRNPSQRVKTPGDISDSVRRKIRSSKTLSLYDDRMMAGNSI